MNKIHIYGPQFSTFVRSVQLCCEEKGISYTIGTVLDGEQIEYMNTFSICENGIQEKVLIDASVAKV